MGTCCFHNHRWHLNQVQWTLPIFQRLSQVQDLYGTTEQCLSCPARSTEHPFQHPSCHEGRTRQLAHLCSQCTAHLASHDSNLLVKLSPVKTRVFLQEREQRTQWDPPTASCCEQDANSSSKPSSCPFPRVSCFPHTESSAPGRRITLLCLSPETLSGALPPFLSLQP